MPTSKLGILQVINSSLWITVLVVRVGCIIEAHPSPNNNKVSHHPPPPLLFTTTSTELEASASHSIFSSSKNSLAGSISKKGSLGPQQISSDGAVAISTRSLVETTSSSTTTASSIIASRKPNLEHDSHGEMSISDGNVNHKHKSQYPGDDDEDNCSNKADGYYQNFGSGCSSYYFCAAGFQITYVCPNGIKFNGKRCQENYDCPTAGHHIINDCKDKSNGYYSNKRNVGKYFYCFNQAKVVELQCDAGKVFLSGKCIHPADATGMLHPESEEVGTCSQKGNGFYQDFKSNCESYYYCIGGEKRELKCQPEYIFNGDICVHRSRYECPNYKPIPEGGNLNATLKKAKGADQRRSREVGEKGKLPIIGKTSGTLDENDHSSGTIIPEIIEKTTVSSLHLNEPNGV